jgi:hypothetical protein
MGHIYGGFVGIAERRQSRRWAMRPVAETAYHAIQIQQQAKEQWVVPADRLFDPLTIFGPVLAAMPVNIYGGENRT